ncbi:MAG: acetyl-CoA carboxylase biotin carboxyl carrier protein [Balneolaceae bacterium]
MDLKLIKNILTMISDSDVNEVSIEEGDFKIKVKKTGAVEQVTFTQPVPAAPMPIAAPAAAPATPAAPAEATPAPSAKGETMNSPIVGTFYQAPSPESDVFCKVGDVVKKGQTLCIIEAMKIMNEIEAEFGGTVKEILVSDGTPVEFGQPLFIIEKN